VLQKAILEAKAGSRKVEHAVLGESSIVKIKLNALLAARGANKAYAQTQVH
jgi:hypothetical protein